jgi:glycerophosphoryl diester phosphodiesterase
MDWEQNGVTTPIIEHHMANLDESPHPPNSLAAIRASLDAGAAIIEIDVQALRVADYVLLHDSTLDRETDGSGPVAELTVEAIKAVKRKNSDQPPVLLSEIVPLFQDIVDVRLHLDFKSFLPFATTEPLERFANLLRPLKDRVIVSTGVDWQLRRLRHIAPWLDLGLDPGFYLDWRGPDAEPNDRTPPYYRGAYGYLDADLFARQALLPTADYLAERYEGLKRQVDGLSTFYVSHTMLVQSLADGFSWADALHADGLQLATYTMDIGKPIAEANLPLVLNADSITTNTPIALAERVAEMNDSDTI